MSLTWIQHHDVEWFKNVLKEDVFTIKIWNSEVTTSRNKLEVNALFQTKYDM